MRLRSKNSISSGVRGGKIRSRKRLNFVRVTRSCSASETLESPLWRRMWTGRRTFWRYRQLRSTNPKIYGCRLPRCRLTTRKIRDR